jgi:Transposase DDE domain
VLRCNTAVVLLSDLIFRQEIYITSGVLSRLSFLPLLHTLYRTTERDRRHQTNGAAVRVMDCRLEGVADAEPIYRLVTTILDPAGGPAAELAALYQERWEIEGSLDELKTHRRGAQIVLRSKTPDLVRQEFWGLLLAHFAIRGLTHEAALQAGEDPDRLSFLHAVRVVCRKLPPLWRHSPLGRGRHSMRPC